MHRIRLWWWLAVALFAGNVANANEALTIAVSVPPQAFLVDRIGGDRVKVEVMIPPGASHEAYAPAPRQMVALGRAHAYVAVGHPGFNIEAQRIMPFLRDHPNVQVIDMFAGARLLPATHRHDHGAAEDNHDQVPQTDPHVWLSPDAMRVAARNLAAALAQLDPDGWDGYFARRDALLRDIDAVDQALAARFRTVPHRRFFVYHAAWGYFAAQYGLEQVAIEEGDKAPTAERFVQLVRAARDEGVTMIFVEKGLADKTARVLAKEIGAQIVELDTLAYDWLANMKAVGERVAQALQR